MYPNRQSNRLWCSIVHVVQPKACLTMHTKPHPKITSLYLLQVAVTMNRHMHLSVHYWQPTHSRPRNMQNCAHHIQAMKLMKHCTFPRASTPATNCPPQTGQVHSLETRTRCNSPDSMRMAAPRLYQNMQIQYDTMCRACPHK